MAFGGLLLALVLAPPLVGQEGWQAGERALIEVRQHDESRQSMPPDVVRELEVVMDARLRLHVEQVDERGRIQAGALRVERFVHQRGTATPTSASLPLRVARPAADARLTAEAEAGGVPLSGPLKAFVGELLGLLDGDLAAALAPPEEEGSPGGDPAQEWRPAPAALARAFVPAGADVEAGRPQEGLVLRRSEPHPGLVRVQGDGPLPLRTLPGARGARVEGAPTSRLELRAEWPRDRSPARQVRLESAFRFQGSATNRLPDGKEQRIEVELLRRLNLRIAPE